MRHWLFIASGRDSYRWYLNCAALDACWGHRAGKGAGFRQIAAGDQAIFYVAGRKEFLAYARVAGLDAHPPYKYCCGRRLLLNDFSPFPFSISLQEAQTAAGFPGTPRGSYRPLKPEVFEGILALALEGRSDAPRFFFSREAELEEFLIANWHQLDFLKDYRLFKDPEGRPGYQYRIGSHERLDLLCRHRVTGDFLVIELKRLAAVKDLRQLGQYMHQVENKIAQGRFAVRGMLLALAIDPRLKQPPPPGMEIKRLDFTIKITNVK